MFLLGCECSQCWFGGRRVEREVESLVLDLDLGRPLICPPLSALLLPLRHHLPAQRQKPLPSAGLTIQAPSTREAEGYRAACPGEEGASQVGIRTAGGRNNKEALTQPRRPALLNSKCAGLPSTCENALPVGPGALLTRSFCSHVALQA